MPNILRHSYFVQLKKVSATKYQIVEKSIFGTKMVTMTKFLAFFKFCLISEIDPWEHLELPFQTWALIVGLVVVFWFFLSCCLAVCCGPRFVECHLCEEPISKRQWSKLGHWDNCARDHERFLNELPDTEFPCPS